MRVKEQLWIMNELRTKKMNRRTKMNILVLNEVPALRRLAFLLEMT